MYEPDELAHGILEEFASRTSDGDARLADALSAGLRIADRRWEQPTGRKRGNRRGWTDEELSLIDTLRTAMGLRELARKFNVNHKTMWYVVKKLESKRVQS